MIRIFIVISLIVCVFSHISFAQELYSKDDIVRSFSMSENQSPYELKWALSERTWNSYEIFISVHSGINTVVREDVAKIYFNDNGKFKLIHSITSQGGYFKKPNVFWYKFYAENSKRDQVHLLQITEKAYGTGSFTKEHLFEIRTDNQEVELKAVEFIPAPQSFQTVLNSGEGVWKGENNQFSEKRLGFEFYIWNEGDGNCCPSAGKVSGEYALMPKNDAGYQMVMAIYHRYDFEPQ